MSRSSDVPGSIRWAADAFSESSASTRPDGSKLILRGIGAGTLVVILLMIFSFSRSADDSTSSLAQDEVCTAPIPPIEQPNDPKFRRRRKATAPITDLAITNALDAGSQILDQDFVIGVELDGDCRAYAINMMGRPETELLNDTLHDQPIAVTFCGTCQSALVFSRRAANRTLTFFLSGELKSDNMVMEDAETGSKWVQLTGRAIAGSLTGQQLEQLPATWTDWKTWRESHPATTAPQLPRLVENYQHHPLYSQFQPERSFFSTLQWGFAIGDKARSWPYARLVERPLVNDRIAGQPVLVLFDRKTSTSTGFDRRIDGAELTFQIQSDAVFDDRTHSRWDPITGRALSGPMKGRRLTPLPGTVSLPWAWRNFFPAGETWSGEALP
jgi:Protein of unknown function (DUF3179)